MTSGHSNRAQRVVYLLHITRDAFLSAPEGAFIISGSLFFVFFFILVDVEVFELVRSLGVGNNTEPVTEVVSLQVFLGKIFQVSLGEVNISVDLDFGLGG